MIHSVPDSFLSHLKSVVMEADSLEMVVVGHAPECLLESDQ